MGKRLKQIAAKYVYRNGGWPVLCAFVAVLLACPATRAADLREWRVTGGTATLQLSSTAIAGSGVALYSDEEFPALWGIEHPVTPGSTLTMDVTGGNAALAELRLDFNAGLIVNGDRQTLRTGNMQIDLLTGSGPTQLVISGATAQGQSGLVAHNVDVRVIPQRQKVILSSESVTLSSAWAKALGDDPNVRLAELMIELSVESLDPTIPAFSAPAQTLSNTGGFGGVAGDGTGPDVIVSAVSGSVSYGFEDVDPAPDSEQWVSAFSIGSTSCNISDEILSWIFATNQHPVIVQNMYRLKDNRFEQIGMSWIKHGFFATDGNSCGVCTDTDNSVPGTLGLAPGCSDLYSASLNGNWRYMGPRSVVNAYTGFFPGPPPVDTRPIGDVIGRRVQVNNDDLYPSTNVGANYFNEIQYVTPDDATAGNGTNNASYKPINVIHLGGEDFVMSTAVGPTVQQLPAIYAWAAADPTVIITEVTVPDEGLFVVGTKVTDLNDGFFRYEYAIFNMTSDRSGGSFSVPLPDGASVLNAGFHDVFYHSGEPYDGTDWPVTIAPGSISWATTPYATDVNANALRWSTLYNFRFDASVAPFETTATLGLFKPGTPESVGIVTLGPATGLVDCNGNGISDLCDVDCARLGCSAPDCETSDDCNGNGIPDECEPDCNGNNIPDACDLDWETGAVCVGCQGATGTADDCDGNLVPDVCDPDCDGDGIPTACETVTDTDADSVDDCDDLCPYSTPLGVCDCVPQCCCSGGTICFPGLTPEQCLANAGCFPDCQVPKCRDGCLLGDTNDDGDVDLTDVAKFGTCFSGDIAEAGFVAPGADCLRWFDFDEDGDVDVDDYFQDIAGERYLFYDAFSGP